MDSNLPFEIAETVSEILAQYSQKELKQASEILSENYRQSERTGKSFISDEIFAAVYCATRMPATYAACMRAFTLTFNELENTEITSHLDCGSGTGAGALAVKNVFAPKSTLLFDRESYMTDICARFLPKERSTYIAGDILHDVLPMADLVTAGYMLNELPSFEDVLCATKRMFDSAKKLLIIVDNGTPDTARMLRLVADYCTKTLGGHIVAPCKGNNCTLKSDDWCAFSVRLARSKAHIALKDGALPFEDEKFSFFAISKEPVSHVGNRVLRTNKKSDKLISLTLCNAAKVEEVIFTKRQKDLFKTAKKSHNGDNFSND